MAVYKIITMPDSVLKKPAKPVTNINAGVLRVLDNMRDTMRDANGVGLAAPQIGISRRIAIVDCGNEEIIELINPEIIFREGKQLGKEGCLSVPGVVGWVERDLRVKVKALDRNGEEFVIEGEDLVARAFQHEIDHLDGVIFTEKADKLMETE